MISFRPKKILSQDMVPEILDYFKSEGIKVNIITPEQADEVSRVNSKAMVLVSFIKNENGKYQIQVQDKECYRYTQKFIRDILRLKILNVDPKTRIVTAESNSNKGIMFDILDILGRKYNLSVVVNK